MTDLPHQDPRTVPSATVRLFGIDVASMKTGDVVAQVMRWAGTGPARTVITVNLDHVLKLQDDATFRAAYRSADLVIADGWPLVCLSRLEGQPLPERVPGADLIVPVAQAAARARKRVFLFGSTVTRLEAAAAALNAVAPGLVVAGLYSPPFGYGIDGDQEEIAEAIREARPDIIFVALGAPKQEVWSAAMAARMERGVFLNIGAGLDFLSGEVRRAPRLVCAIGCEWLWRAGTEPRRLGPRYARILLALPRLLHAHYRERREKKR